jgi:membrane fusion protein (multidrug efflux system)
MSSTDTSADARPPIAHDEGMPPLPPRTRLQRWRLPIMGGVVGLALIVALILFLTGGRFQSTDDAEIQGARVSVSSTIAGRVVNINVRDNQFVRAGQVLFQLDGRPYQTAYQEAQANLAAAKLQVEGLRATVGQRQADLAAAEDKQSYLEADAQRQKALVGAGTATQQQADQAASLADQGRQQVRSVREQLANAQAALGAAGSSTEDHPLVAQARARVAEAGLNKSYVDVVAAQDGVVTKVDQLQVGDYTNAAAPVFSLVSTRLWIEANFKESQLEYMRPGQHATVKIDAYPDQRFDAHVEAISPGTGSSFSLLPAENATGNWVKVSQRVPVRIVFDKRPDVPLESGLSVSVKVDTAHHRHLFGGSKAPATGAGTAP